MNDHKAQLQRAHREIGPPPEPAFDRLLDRRRRRRHASRITSIAMAFAVVSAGVAGALYAFQGAGTAGPGVSSGGGQGSATGPNLVAGPGQYYYSKTQIYFSGSASTGVVGPWTLSIWFAPDASGRSVFAGRSDPQGTGGQSFGWRGGPDQTYRAGSFPLEDLSSLPTDPNELLQRLTVRSSAGGASPNPIPTSSPGRSEQDTALLRTLQDLFNGDEQFTPPAVRAAMFDAASRVDGVQQQDGVVDPVGRPAIGLKWEIFYQDTPSYVEWFFDPSSKQLMAETWTQDGSLLEGRVVTDAGIAGSTDGPPAAADRFFPPADRAPSFVGG